MCDVTRLVTVVDLDDGPGPIDAAMLDSPAADGVVPGLATRGPKLRSDDPRSMSLSALHLAVLRDGRRLTLLDDRGWAASGPPDIWCRTSVEDVEETAREMVGPDEPYDGHSESSMAAEHWAALATKLRQEGVLIDADQLSRLPHDIELSERLRTRLDRPDPTLP
jgi:hypothetical protein